MKMAAFSKLAKQTGSCTVFTKPDEAVTSDREMLISNGQAIYRCGALPEAKNDEAIKALLGISDKEAEKVRINGEEYETLRDVCGFDLSTGTAPSESDLEEYKVGIICRGETYTAVKCSDGEMLLYNPKYLAPIADRAKSQYFKLASRTCVTLTKHFNYIVAKDGFETVAMILPIAISAAEFVEQLAELTHDCENQVALEMRRMESCRSAHMEQDAPQ